jgi:hypothetical protein
MGGLKEEATQPVTLSISIALESLDANYVLEAFSDTHFRIILLTVGL